MHPVVQNIGVWLLVMIPFLISLTSVRGNPAAVRQALLHLFPSLAFFALPIYTHAFLILPRLYKRQYLSYLLLFAVNVGFWSVVGYYLGQYGLPPIRAQNFIIQLFMVGSITVFGALIKIARDAIVRNHESRKAELKLLRDQINPHFLFNTLNNLYGLAVQRSDRLPPLMLRLSDLLRYSLYETREGQVPLERELHYIRNYVSLESIRLDERADIRLRIGGEAEGLRIAPLLLIVFVENCFKHLSTAPGEKGFVHIDIQVKNGQLHFQTVNSCWTDNEAHPAARTGGLGLVNVRKRLELLYPGRYDLQQRAAADRFEINLKLDLS